MADSITDLVFFSGGIGSWAAAKRVAMRPDVKHITLLFADTLIEDEDLYRFLDDATANINHDCTATLTRIADGRDPWQVFEDVKYLGNTRIDPCSRILKRDLLNKWRDTHCDPNVTRLHFGIDWTESHRIDRIKARTPEWNVSAPLCEAPYLDKPALLSWAKTENLQTPRLYDLGFFHNNCGGFCIKSGQAQYELLLRTLPARYAYHEKKEGELRKKLGKNITILRDRTGGKTRPLSLKEFRLRLQEQPDLFDKFEFGGCGCAVD